jgi:hypothetical protein
MARTHLQKGLRLMAQYSNDPHSTIQGLDVAVTQEANGWHAIATDPTGTVVFDRAGYKTLQSAKAGVNYWVKGHYKRPGRQAGPPSSADQLVKTMEATADRNEAQSVLLRQQAETLEADAKRLRAAIDVLRGPNGD